MLECGLHLLGGRYGCLQLNLFGRIASEQLGTALEELNAGGRPIRIKTNIKWLHSECNILEDAHLICFSAMDA